ncbi:Pyruvate kinase [Smittium mucronatum]|uniref:Pyruvate kinase n=1 Tax=Smittium mucronatum TaxID=133383 RepID=A0A1R0GZ85_9FUNG|nr:Pyruvate kinase [Smittium mucronatum]
MSGQRINTRLEWNSQLSTDINPNQIRKSSIICTIGPATQSVDMLVKLLEAGMNIMRMNFSHGTHEYHTITIENLRAAAKLANIPTVGIALDTKGPEIRTGNMKNGDVPFNAGHEMIFTLDEKFKDEGDLNQIFIDYRNLSKVLSPGKIIYIDDGIMEFKVLECHDDHVKVVAVNSGTLASHKGVNLPGSNVDLPALSEKDISDLKFGIKMGVDMIFASFIRTANDVLEIRKVLGEEGKGIKIVSKIESTQGVENFDDILKVTDSVMIARGDLGIEIPPAKVFLAQKSMIAKCNVAGVPVIVATQMLESMTYNPRPTRAEISDVANAIIDGADCVMLSGETAKGKYPLEAVKMMSETAILAEMSINHLNLYRDLRTAVHSSLNTTEATCASAVDVSFDQKAKLIICLTTSGESARLLSKYRPDAPILVLTRQPRIARNAHLNRGCFPIHYVSPKPDLNSDIPVERDQWQVDVENRIQFAIDHAISRGLCQKGDKVVSIQGWRGGVGNTNTMRILTA